MSFSVISQFFLFFLGGCPKFSFFDNLAQKTRTLKHYKIGVLAFFEKNICVTKRPFLDQKNQNPEIPVIIFLPVFFFFSTTKNTKHCRNPYFYRVLANLKKENFQNLNFKTLKIVKLNFCTLFLKKAIFRKLPDNWAQRKHKMITECAK